MKLTQLLLTLLLIGLSSSVFAQFEDDESAAEEVKEDLNEDLEDEGPANKKLETGRDGQTQNAEITSEDLKKLSEAKKAKSEAALLKIASDILSRNPDHLETLNTLGIFYYEQKKFGMAKILFKRAMQKHGKEPALHNNLGIVYLAENELRLAIETFKKSLALNSSYRFANTNLSSIYLEYGDFERSLEPIEEAYKATRSDLKRGEAVAVEIANNYALALVGIGENEKAKGIYENIMESSARNPVPFLNYAILLVEVQKKKKDAVRVISKLKFMTEDREILRRVEELEKKME